MPLASYRDDARAYGTIIAAIGQMFEEAARAAGYQPAAELVDGVAEMVMDEYGWSLTADEWAVFLQDLFGGRLEELYGLRRDIIGRCLRSWLADWRQLVHAELERLREEAAFACLPPMSEEQAAENQRRIKEAIEKLRKRLTENQ